MVWQPVYLGLLLLYTDLERQQKKRRSHPQPFDADSNWFTRIGTDPDGSRRSQSDLDANIISLMISEKNVGVGGDAFQLKSNQVAIGCKLGDTNRCGKQPRVEKIMTGALQFKSNVNSNDFCNEVIQCA